MILFALAGVLAAAAAWFVARPLVAGAPGPAPRAARRRPVAVALGVAVLVAGAALVPVLHRATPATPAAASTPSVRTPSARTEVAASSPAPASTTAPSASGDPTQPPLTDDQLAALSSAIAQVRAQPRDVAAHLDLARAYAGAEQPQLSTVEYLAVLKLDPANPEAGSALALVALAAGKPEEGRKLVDAVLARQPRYPDALYTRGLINLMGLHQAGSGVRDLRAYLAAAPYGSHRSAVETLLAMVSDGRTP